MQERAVIFVGRVSEPMRAGELGALDAVGVPPVVRVVPEKAEASNVLTGA